MIIILSKPYPVAPWLPWICYNFHSNQYDMRGIYAKHVVEGVIYTNIIDISEVWKTIFTFVVLSFRDLLKYLTRKWGCYCSTNKGVTDYILTTPRGFHVNKMSTFEYHIDNVKMGVLPFWLLLFVLVSIETLATLFVSTAPFLAHSISYLKTKRQFYLDSWCLILGLICLKTMASKNFWVQFFMWISTLRSE